MIDKALETILKARLVPTDSQEDSLIEGAYAPISNFSARIDLAHRIGLISTKLCRDLHIIRKIRNDFAHNITGCSFDDTAVRSRIIELNRSSQIIDKYPKIREQLPEGCRGDFQITISWMLWYLWGLPEVIQSIEPSPIEWGYLLKNKENRSNAKKV